MIKLRIGSQEGEDVAEACKSISQECLCFAELQQSNSRHNYETKDTWKMLINLSLHIHTSHFIAHTSSTSMCSPGTNIWQQFLLEMEFKISHSKPRNIQAKDLPALEI